MSRVLYASDMDRTLIFSDNFIREYPSEKSYTPVEYKDGRVISNMCDEVKDRLHKLKDNKQVTFVPVTTRSIAEYNRVDIGFIPEYAIMANGGKILHNGVEMEEWNDYIKSGFKAEEAMNIIVDIEDELTSVDYKVKVIDGCYLFFKTEHPELFDIEVMYLMNKYPDWEFTRQVKKCYAIPKHFSKQIALRWLWHKLDKPFIVASGDSELDLPMLTLANKAIIPSHGSLVKEKFVEDGTFADGGIASSLATMNIVEEYANK